MTSGLETEWDFSGRKGRDGQKKKIGKAKERNEKVKRGKDEEVNGQGRGGVPRPHTGDSLPELDADYLQLITAYLQVTLYVLQQNAMRKIY